MPRYYLIAALSRCFPSAGPRRILPLFLLSLPALYSTAQIQVSQEPRHHKVFENDWVRILDVHVPPGDTTLFHEHSTPSVFLVLTNTKTGSEVIMEPEKAHFTDGNIFFESFAERPRVHRVWNSDTSEFHVMDMELPNPVHAEIGPPLSSPDFQLLFDEKPVRGYRLSLKGNAFLRLEKINTSIVIISLADMAIPVRVTFQKLGNTDSSRTTGQGQTGGSAVKQAPKKKSFAKKGDFLFVPAGMTITFVNRETVAQPFALFELK